MKNNIERKQLWFFLVCILFLCVIFLLGCDKSSQPGFGTSEDIVEEKSAPYYHITEYEIPDADKALSKAGVLEDDSWWAEESALIFGDGKLYRFVNIYKKDENDMSFSIQYNYIQIFEEPYSQWKNTKISMECIEDDQINIVSVTYCGQDHFVLNVSYSVWEIGDDDYILTEKTCVLDYRLGDKPQILVENEDSNSTYLWVQTHEGKLYRLESFNNALISYDNEYQKEEAIKLSATLIGIVYNPLKEQDIWYGRGKNGIIFWEKPAGLQLYPEAEEVDKYKAQVAFSIDGTPVVADKRALFLYKDQNWEKLLNLIDKGYILESLDGLSILDDGKILMCAAMDGVRYILVGEEMDSSLLPMKQEITIAIPVVDSSMRKVISNYNRGNEKYHVNIQSMQDTDSYEDFCRKIQLEISAGNGPDIVSSMLISIRDYARNGYLKSLDGVIAYEDAFVSSTLPNGKFNGITYGIPYSSIIILAVFPKDSVQDKESITAKEMMEAVGRSDAQVLMIGYDAPMIIYYCGLLDMDNKSYIDWEKRESHLNEEPFLDLVEFANKYADRQQFSYSEIGKLKVDGGIAAEAINLYRIGVIDYADKCFGKREVSYIGFPAECGPGIYMTTYYLCMNQSSNKDDGVRDFLQYLISEKGQTLYLDNTESFMNGRLSVRWSVIDKGIEQYNELEKKPIKVNDQTGLSWSEDGLSEEQEITIRRLISQAKTINPEVEEIYAMLYEELEPYFSGEKTAKECLDILDSRVQLYLDE